MQAYIFAAALLCEACGDNVRADLQAKGRAPEDPDNESTYDSDDYPKGPYSDGGGEADTPQHCDHCGGFLENPLTRDGYAYVREALRHWVAPDDSAEEGPQSDGAWAYAELIAGRILDESASLRLPALTPELTADNARRAEVLGSVTSVWAEFYPEAWDKREGGPC